MRTRFPALPPFAFSLAFTAYAQMQAGPSKSTTLTGCLEKGSEPDSYMLHNASMRQLGSSESPNKMARSVTSYKLIPDRNVDLKDHIGHKVEVTGSLMHGSYSETNETPEFRVSSIRHLSATPVPKAAMLMPRELIFPQY